MKKMLLSLTATAFMLTAGLAQAKDVSITGAGSTFVTPILTKWAYTYNKKTGVKLNYQSIGSGGGIKQIEAKTVDFGASDAPLTAKQLEDQGLSQFPDIVGGVVPVVNIKGIKAGQLKLDGETLADIYLGKITKWNDPAIAKLNPGLNLPDSDIGTVHRADGSGTTWIFTNYLTKVSADWASKIGNDKAVDWPGSNSMGGKGNEGVAAFVNKVPNSIGYVEYAYALQNHMAYVLMKNKDGNYVAPTAKNFQAAAAGADWKHAPGFYMVLTNQPGANSWPITGASFILVHKKADNAKQTKEVLKFLIWGFRHGGKAAMKLDYVPLPQSVVDLIEASWRADITDASGNRLWK
ncbi:MAG TPA: phosphate ABC transporter substrate-binding protein PstS [Mariprofundaceae bacterium]|nr:phosphate ABC transporter substrate-binding protein PstS [Mariprofundaceae bacterium]